MVISFSTRRVTLRHHDFRGSSRLGTVYELTPSGTESVLYSSQASDGETPENGLISTMPATSMERRRMAAAADATAPAAARFSS